MNRSRFSTEPIEKVSRLRVSTLTQEELSYLEKLNLDVEQQIKDYKFKERRWLKTHGKEHRITFNDHERKELRKYFNALDTDGSGRIEMVELEEPLIALGLVSTRAEVQRLFDEVDKDKTGEIEFNEFLEIMSKGKKGTNESSDHSMIYNFFKSIHKLNKKWSTANSSNQSTRQSPSS